MRLAPVALFLIIVFGFAPLAVTLTAQDFSVEEDLEYARGLMTRRMHDLAKKVLDRIIDDGNSSDGEKASANLEIANLFKDKFARGLTFDERIEASEKADAAYREFVTNYGDHPRILLAKFDYAEFLVYLGRYRIQLQDETVLVGGTREKAEEHRAIALEKLKKAADLFEELVVAIPGSGKEEELAELLELCQYYRAILHYDVGRAEKDEANRSATFQEGINALEEYIFENEDNLRGFRGYLYKGLCHREFAEASHKADALAMFEGVIYAFKNVIGNPQVGWKNWGDALADPSAKDLLENTFWRFAETYNRYGENEKAIALVDEMKKIYADAGAGYGNPGYRALLQQAEAQFLTGKVSEAIGAVSDVASRAGTGNKFIEFHCDRYLARFLDEVDDKTQLDADVVFKAAKGAYTQDRWLEAMRHFQTVLAIKKGVGPVSLDCWNYIGRCYEGLGYQREYALATATGAFNLKAADEGRALSMAQRARKTLQRIAAATKSAKDRARFNRHKATMDQVFGAVSGARFDPATAAMGDRNFERAIEEFGSIQPDAEKYELARAYIVWCTLCKTEKTYTEKTSGKRIPKAERKAAQDELNAGYAETIKLADRYFAFAKTNAIRGEPVKKKNREQAHGVAALAKAAALKGLGRWNDSLAVLGYFEGIGASQASRSQLQQAQTLKVQLMLGKGKLSDAAKELEKLEKSFPAAAKSVVNLKGMLGSEFQNLAAAEEKRGRKPAALSALVKSVNYRLAWIKGITPKIENLFSLAKDLYTLNRFDEAKTYLDEIMTRWGDIEKPRSRLRKTLRLTRIYLARCLIWQGKYMEAEPILRDLYNAKRNDLTMLKEYAALLTGAVRTVDGKLAYLPGRGAHKDKKHTGYKLWGRLVKRSEDKITAQGRAEYLEARFHQNLYRWAQGAPEMAQSSIEQLRVSLGKQLDRKPGARKLGFWETRYNWLEKRLRVKAPQTPPPMPTPRG